MYDFLAKLNFALLAASAVFLVILIVRIAMKKSKVQFAILLAVSVVLFFVTLDSLYIQQANLNRNMNAQTVLTEIKRVKILPGKRKAVELLETIENGSGEAAYAAANAYISEPGMLSAETVRALLFGELKKSADPEKVISLMRIYKDRDYAKLIREFNQDSDLHVIDENEKWLSNYGSNPKGKAIVYVRDLRPEKKESYIDVGLTVELDNDLWPTSTEEIEYVILLEKTYNAVGAYAGSNTATAYELNVDVSILTKTGDVIFVGEHQSAPPNAITKVSGQGYDLEDLYNDFYNDFDFDKYAEYIYDAERKIP